MKLGMFCGDTFYQARLDLLQATLAQAGPSFSRSPRQRACRLRGRMPILTILPNLVPFALLPLSARTVPNAPRLPTRINPQPPRLPARLNPQPRAAAVLMMDGADDGAADLALLSRRINELKSVCKMQALCLPEVLLPGQRSTFAFACMRAFSQGMYWLLKFL